MPPSDISRVFKSFQCLIFLNVKPSKPDFHSVNLKDKIRLVPPVNFGESW